MCSFKLHTVHCPQFALGLISVVCEKSCLLFGSAISSQKTFQVKRPANGSKAKHVYKLQVVLSRQPSINAETILDRILPRPQPSLPSSETVNQRNKQVRAWMLPPLAPISRHRAKRFRPHLPHQSSTAASSRNIRNTWLWKGLFFFKGLVSDGPRSLFLSFLWHESAFLIFCVFTCVCVCVCVWQWGNLRFRQNKPLQKKPRRDHCDKAIQMKHGKESSGKKRKDWGVGWGFSELNKKWKYFTVCRISCLIFRG